MENGIYEAFCIEGGRKCFYQWDLNQKIIVNDRNIDEVHFCNGTSDKSLVSVVKDGKASVPNVLLQVACKVKVYGYSVNHTVVEKVYEVKARTKPEDYVYEETEVYRWAELDKRILTLEEIGIPEDGKSAYEIAKENGFEGTEEEWLESLRGKDGDTHVFLVREIIDGISDKSKEEAEAAAKAGKAVFLVTKYGEVYSYYAKEKNPDTNVYEILFVMPITKAATGKRRSYIFLGADNALSRKSETPFTAVAENPLIVKTATSQIEYDGSEKKEIDLTNLGGGGSGGGIPATTDPHQMLVTDSNGVTKWEERTHYHEHSESTEDILPETEVVDVEGDLCITGNPFVLEAGSTYNVTYNGNTYECVAFSIEGEKGLGNAKVLDETFPGNNEPFIIVSTQGNDISGGGVEGGIYGMLLPLDEVTNFTISIIGVVVIDELKKIPPKFMPKFLQEQKLGEYEEEIVFLPEVSVPGLNSDTWGYSTDAFEKTPKPGQTVIVRWNGVEYECKAMQSTNDWFDIVLGSSSTIGGADNKKCPFAIGIVSATSDIYLQGFRIYAIQRGANSDNDATNTFSVFIPKGYVQTLDTKYLDRSIAQTFNIYSTKYDAFIANEEFTGNNEYYTTLTPDEATALFSEGRFTACNLFTTETDSADNVIGLIVPLETAQIYRENTGLRVILNGKADHQYSGYNGYRFEAQFYTSSLTINVTLHEK